MRGWVWLARAKRWIGCGDLQDGMLNHYQQMVPLSDWSIEKRVEEALPDHNPLDLRVDTDQSRVYGGDGEEGRDPQG